MYVFLGVNLRIGALFLPRSLAELLVLGYIAYSFSLL